MRFVLYATRAAHKIVCFNHVFCLLERYTLELRKPRQKRRKNFVGLHCYFRKDFIMAETRTGDTTSTNVAGQTSQRGLTAIDTSVTVLNDPKTSKGKTTIANGVVAKIVGIAAREIDGVKDVVGTGAGGTISGLATRVTRGDTRSQGVSVAVGEREAAASINIIAYYGVSIP